MRRRPSGITLVAIALASLVVVLGWARLLRAESSEETSRVTSVFAVEGMTCGGCEAGVRFAVGKLAGVETVEASYREHRAEVTYDPAQVTPEQIIDAIEELGYTAELVEDESAASRNESGPLAGLLSWC